MKVGILTQHRVRHFGSILQAYALQRILFDNGIDNEIIDYIYPNSAHKKTPILVRLKIGIHIIIRRLYAKKSGHIYSSNISEFIENSLIKSNRNFDTPQKLRRYCPTYDVYLTGSDQVWNTEYLRGDKSFFFPWVGRSGRSGKKISYASSFGKFTLTGRKAQKWLVDLQDYSHVSVREKKAAEIVRNYTGKCPEVVLDPTLLLNRSQWLLFAKLSNPKRKDYILVYLLTYVWNPMPYSLQLIDYICEITGYNVIVIEPESAVSHNANWKYVDNPSPVDFIRLFSEAALVVTNSFHGTAFSINLNVPFLSLTRDNNVDNDDRLQSLLEQLELTDHIVKENESFPPLPIPYSSKNEKLVELRKQSIDFLINSIYK